MYMYMYNMKPNLQGRDVVDATQDKHICRVNKCGSNRCKMCSHMCEGDVFTSNLTQKTYNIVSPNMNMTCSTKNVIYLITCIKCGIQYVGETSQSLRCRFNNHRNRLKHFCDLHLYNHFNSDGHTDKDIIIIPIEEVILDGSDNITLASKRLEREEFWYRELGSIYPYGLNDNVRKIGNISQKIGDGTIVYSLFNRQPRKYKKRQHKRKRNKLEPIHLQKQTIDLLKTYKSIHFSNNRRTYILGLPKKRLQEVLRIAEELILNNILHKRILLLVKDIVTYRCKPVIHNALIDTDINAKQRNYMNVFFHNKGIEMINLPQILNNKRVISSIPTFFTNRSPPLVSYSYTKSIANKNF